MAYGLNNPTNNYFTKEMTSSSNDCKQKEWDCAVSRTWPRFKTIILFTIKSRCENKMSKNRTRCRHSWRFNCVKCHFLTHNYLIVIYLMNDWLDDLICAIWIDNNLVHWKTYSSVTGHILETHEKKMEIPNPDADLIKILITTHKIAQQESYWYHILIAVVSSNWPRFVDKLKYSLNQFTSRTQQTYVFTQPWIATYYSKCSLGLLESPKHTISTQTHQNKDRKNSAFHYAATPQKNQLK